MSCNGFCETAIDEAENEASKLKEALCSLIDGMLIEGNIQEALSYATRATGVDIRTIHAIHKNC